MRTTYLLRYVALAATMFGFATAQDSVPKDLTAAFADSGVELQVSFTNNAVDGFKDGISFGKDEVSKEPTFALGDSSGISTTTLFTVIMLDTSSDSARTLHYVRSNFKSSGVVNIDTKDSAILTYKAPGAFGETGDDRKYTFLMYRNPQRSVIKTLKMPDEGKTFDVKKFQTDNGFVDPAAGVGMVVKLGGGDGDGGGQASSSSSAASSAAESSSSSAVSSSSSIASSTSATARLSSVSSSIATSSAVASSSSVPATSAASRVPSTVSTLPSATSATARLSSSVPVAAPTVTGSSQNRPSASTGTAAPSDAGSASSMDVAPTAPSGASGSSRATGSANSTASAPLSVQTDSFAWSVSMDKNHCVVAALVLIALSLF